VSKLKQVNQSGYNKGYLAGKHDSAERIAELEAKLDAAHNWVLNTCPEEYNQFVKALGEAK